MVYLLVPRLRRLVIKTLRQIKAFTGFVVALNRPIATNGIMGAGERDVRVTIMAKERVRGLEMTHGLGLELWGKALEALDGQFGPCQSSMGRLLIRPRPSGGGRVDGTNKGTAIARPKPPACQNCAGIDPESIDTVPSGTGDASV